MNRRAFLIAPLATLAACVAPPVPVVASQPVSAPVVVAEFPPNPYPAPPPPQVERIPPPPNARYVWQPGHWHWNGAAYVWRRGHYVAQYGHRWEPAHWRWNGRVWVWEPGRWM